MIANSIIYRNAYILSALYTAAEKAGKREETELLKRISPIAWRHINLRGRFEFQKQTPMLNIDEIISTLGQKTNWQQLEEFEEMLEQAPYFTFSVR